MALLKGWKYVAFLGTIVGAIGVTLYPIVVYPMLNSSEYKKIQHQNRRGIKQDEIQPGKKGSDFDQSKDTELLCQVSGKLTPCEYGGSKCGMLRVYGIEQD